VKASNVPLVGMKHDKFVSVQVEAGGRHVSELVLDCVD
jgi:hypothetical protein